MIFSIFIIILPLLVVVAAGYFISKLHKIDSASLSRALTDFFLPAMAFHSLYTSKIVFMDTAKLFGAVIFSLFLLAFFSLIYSKITRTDFSDLGPSICFMNTGFLGIPLMALWGGSYAVNVEVIIDQIQNIFIFSLGLMMVTGGFNAKSFKEMVKAPILWAIVAGFLFNAFNIRLPDIIIKTAEFSGSGVMPLAAFIVGASIAGKPMVFNRHLVFGLLLRFLGGFIAGLLGALVLGLQDTMKTVFIIAMSLPSAIFTYVLPVRYGRDAELAGSMLIVSTVMGIFTIPVVIYLAGLL